jgi:glycerol-3-phosphate acyltransferase PlsX
VVIPGALRAAHRLRGQAQVVVVGAEDVLRDEIRASGGHDEDVEIVHAPQNIEMGEAPAAAIRRKPDSSIAVGARLMRDGHVDAFVSAGSTGAVTAAATLIVGRLSGVARPGIATVLPTARGIGLVIDVGANANCRPLHLLQFGAMGRIYSERVLGRRSPSVGLLNIGEEPGKGNELTQEAHRLLAAYEPAFIGNIESKHIFDGRAAVVVTDGFVGNVVLKILESFGGFLIGSFREEIKGDLRATAGAWLLRPAIREFARRFNYAEYGGAPLLGCRGVIIICHGASSSLAIANAVRVAERGVRDGISRRIQEEIEREREAQGRMQELADAFPDSDPVPTPDDTTKGNNG